MKKLLVFLLALSLALSLAACGGGAETAQTISTQVGSVFPPEGEIVPLQLNLTTTSKSNWPTGTPKPVSTMSYETIQLVDRSACSGLSSSLDTLNAQISNDATAVYRAGGNVALEGQSEDPGATNPDGKEVSYASTANVRRSDTAVVSVLVDVLQGMEEAMSESCYSVNYYTSDGKDITLADVALDQNVVLSTAAGYFAAQYPGLDAQTLAGEFSQNTPVWTLDYQGVSFYLPNPSGSGLMTVEIPFSTNLFSTDFTKAPAQFAIPLSANVPANFVTADGTVKTLTVSPQMADDWAVGNIVINWGETTTSFDFYSFSSNYALVHVGDGKDFLYAGGVVEDDYPFLNIYNMSGSVPTLLHTIDGVARHQTANGDGSTTIALLTDPAAVSLDSFPDGETVATTNTVTIGADGIPSGGLAVAVSPSTGGVG